MSPIVRTLPDGLHLSMGSHSPDSQMCMMEAAAYAAGEPWSDAPACVDPVIASYCRTLNDRMPDDVRQQLLPLIPSLLDTAGSRDLMRRRAYLAADTAVRVFAPLALDAIGRVTAATTLRALLPITNQRTAYAAAAAADAVAVANAAANAAYAAANAATYAAYATYAANAAANAATYAAYATYAATYATYAATYATDAADAANAAAAAAAKTSNVWLLAIDLIRQMVALR